MSNTEENKICCSCCVGSPAIYEEVEGENQPLLSKNITRRKMPSLCCSITSVTIGTIFLIFGIVIAILFDPFINSQIDKELILRDDNTSETFKLWLDPPIVPYLKIYFFNVTNVEGFLQRKEKPQLVEVGPYSYREEWHKINVAFHDNATVTYETKKLYFFDPENSVGSESDVITTLNIPVNVAVEKASKIGRLVQLALSSMLQVLNETAFVQKTVRDLVWGYDDPLIDLSKRFLPKDEQLPFSKFGYFYQKNGSTDGVFNVFTGNLSMSNYTIIDTFNYSRELTYWNTPECNRINGTDGTSYPPRPSKKDVIYMFNENLCRSLPLVYNNTLYHQGIQAWRFVPPADVFAEVSKKPENKCFCVGDPPCIGGGVFNISPCKFNVSSVLSWPHFYQAEEKYLNRVNGLKPDPKKHSLFIDLNPTLGMPMSAQARVQINFITKGLATVKAVSNLPNMVFPVLWFEDGVSSLPPNVISLLEKSTYYPMVVKYSILSVSFILGSILFLFGLLALLFFFKSSRQSRVFTTKETSISSTPTTNGSASVSSGYSNPAVSSDNPDYVGL